MKKLLYITNIPAPYRQKRFNKMAEIFPKYGIEFEVLYMAEVEPDRQWIIDPSSYKYKYKVYSGIHPKIGNFFAHFNPSLLIRLLKDDYDFAIVGGMASPTHWLVPFFINSKKIQIMSVESNLHSVARKDGLGAWVKKKLLGKATAYQVTGKPQEEYIKFFNPEAKNKTFITLPNLIDEDVFSKKVNELKNSNEEIRKKIGVDENIQMWVLPARLIQLKGIIPFISVLENISNIKLFLLGDGELLKEIKTLIKNKNLPVICVGFVQENKLIEYYAAADLFVFPSLKDSSPLSPIEAIAAGLPVLLSSRIGNINEVIENNINGWCYDPIKEGIKLKELILQITQYSRKELHNFGINSSKIYEDRFNNDTNIKKYAQSLQNLISNYG